MKNQRKRRFFAVLIMCIFMFTMGTICSATADEDAAVLTIGAEESSIVTVGETEYDLADGDSALAYVDSYADNLEADPNFETNVNTAIDKVRESLEEQTMNMAKAAAELFTKNLKYSNGEPVKVVIADTTIGRVAEAAACAEKFRKEGVMITLSVTPCWCYGSETMDMDPATIKGVWGFNATERPGAVYLAAVLAAHAQKGLPAFGIYGRDVQDADDTTMPEDVKEKLIRFARSAVAVATMKGKSYLQIGSICMGIAGSSIDTDFFEEYLGMRVESVDEVEVIRRMEEGIYDEVEYQ